MRELGLDASDGLSGFEFGSCFTLKIMEKQQLCIRSSIRGIFHLGLQLYSEHRDKNSFAECISRNGPQAMN